MGGLPAQLSFAESYRNESDPGGAFHRFVGEVFSVEASGLTSFLAPGKDGAIDLYDPKHGGVYECKFVGSDGYDSIEPRWREVEKHLKDNLEPNAPKKGASQYRPWYDTAHPIAKYRFCVSARFANKAQSDKLVEQISAAFLELATRSGLAHLKTIEVEVWSWDRFEPLLARRAQLRLRWFGRGLPAGVREFSREQERNWPGFQAYLYGNEKLRYVAVTKELAPSALFDRIVASEQATTVIHGRGGAGKSRLQMEVGRVANAADWLVLQVQADVAVPSLVEPLVRSCGEVNVLLLMDYIERCADWDAWTGALQEFNAEGACVRLLGTCRDSWSERLDTYQSELLQLPESLASTVHGMLVQRPELLPLAGHCEGVPVFAAFLCLLYDTKQHAALASLRGQKDFSRWLQQHIARLPSESRANHDGSDLALVELLINLPCGEAAMHAMENANPSVKTYRAQLHADGWLDWDESAPEHQRWSAVHDVLADGALCRWLSAKPRAGDLQLQRWLSAARLRGNLSPVLATLQRVAQETAVLDRPWHQIFEPAPNSPWLGWIDAILRTRLIKPLEALDWLERLKLDPANAVGSRAVQIAVWDAIKYVQGSGSKNEHLTQVQEDCLIRWTDAAVSMLANTGATSTIELSNHVLTRALRWRPDRYAGASEGWLAVHAAQLQAQFLLNAWLAVGGTICDRQKALPWVAKWLERHGERRVASYVFGAWLEAKGGPDQVRSFLSIWLDSADNALLPSAQFVLTAWLNAKGELELVRPYVKRWLDYGDNALLPSAQFVFTAWLNAKGELELVRPYVKRWLDYGDNALLPGVSFVFEAWLNAKGELELVRPFVKRWLDHEDNALLPDASFVFAAWLNVKGELAFIDPGVRAWVSLPSNGQSEFAGFVIRAYGDRQRHLPEWLLAPACAWVRQFSSMKDAAFVLKYVVAIHELDLQTLLAVIQWCRQFPQHVDALSRLSRAVRSPNIKDVSDRSGLYSVTAAVIDAVLAPANTATRYSVVDGLACVGTLARLPDRNSEEHAAKVALSIRACDLLRLVPLVGVPDLPERFWRFLAAVDWEWLLGKVPSSGTAPDKSLTDGVRAWVKYCHPWAHTERQRSALDRLARRH